MRIVALISFLLVANSVAVAQNVEIAAHVVEGDGRPVFDAVVVAVPADGNLRPPSRSREAMVDQVDKEFTPKVTAILVGTSVSFPNNDNVRHQVYSFSPAKRFELPLYAGVPAQPVVFDKPGVVVLGCNIHDWMVGYIYVSESPYFAKTDKDGRALITELPPGEYVVRVWHPQMEIGEASTRKTVRAAPPQHIDLEWALKLKAEVKVRRAPTSERGGRY
jgi:plastocyanin